MKYESSTLKTTQVIVSAPKSWQNSDVTLTFGPYNVKLSSSHHPVSMYEKWKLYVQLENYCQNQSVDGQTDKPDSYRAPV